ncbi:MAG: hypothetical protein KBD76_08350 [Bacteriovorax sp.]|nr:hypothetical protein [Bacteriovorax sp.]
MFKLSLFLITASLTHFSIAKATTQSTTKEEMKILTQALQEPRNALARALASDAILEKSFQRYALKANEIIARTDLELSQKHQEIRELNLGQRKQLGLLLQASKVDRKSVLANLEVTFKLMKAKYNKEYKWSLDEGMGVHWRTSQGPTGPLPASPITHILSAPFRDRDTSAIGEESSVDLEEGRYRAYSTGIMMMNTSQENGMGHFFSPLPTHNRIKVTGSVSNAEVSLLAMGFAGVSSADAKTFIRIHKSGSMICETEFDHGSVLAIAAWISDEEHGDQFSLDCTIRSTDNVNELNATLTTKVSTMTAGGGASSASVNSKLRDIKIKYFNN